MAKKESVPNAADYEKLGAFYLGRKYNIDSGAVQPDVQLYDAKDLTTHAMCVGMTGSGKTGLCLSLLEEAALDGIPAIAVDPKGDLGNLLLTFPDLAPADFLPWVDEGEARRKGLEPAAYARQTATLWRNGLADWGQDGDRIRRLKEATDVAIYTPGSNAGLPLTVLRSFSAPPAEIAADAEALAERVQAATSGLLTLIGKAGDPLTSREHILVANILSTAWKAGRDLDLPSLIREVQTPPFDRLGVFDLETFIPSGERLQLAMSINNVLASPTFASWLEGEPLDVGKLLFGTDGKPRLSILSIAHLSDSERMFFVTMLLNEILAWVRTQPGTSSLRALLYMDEIFGYFPPTAEPPSKKPMLTLLKQARAYGFGIVLATQNPVDLDYKGLSNTGTWFLGRLQTERDKNRVLDGLEGAATSTGAGFDRSSIEKILSGLGSRVFLMHNVHDDGPSVFHTRWAMSYLRGPLTRSQIKVLMDPRKASVESAPATKATPDLPAPTSPGAAAAEPERSARPVLPPEIEEYFLAPSDAVGDSSSLLYRPCLGAVAKLHFVSAKNKVDHWLDVSVLTPLPDEGIQTEWDASTVLENSRLDLLRGPVLEGDFADLTANAKVTKNYPKWSRALVAFLYRAQEVPIYKCKELRAISRAGETEGEFRGRLSHLARENRDAEIEKLRKKYASKMATLRDRIRRAEAKVDTQRSQLSHRKRDTLLSLGATIAGALLGGKLGSYGSVSRAARSARSFGRSKMEAQDVDQAMEELSAQQQKLAELESQMEDEIVDLQGAGDPSEQDLETVVVRPRKSDIAFSRFGLTWTPWRRGADGALEPLH